jgi:hypothetical protein
LFLMIRVFGRTVSTSLGTRVDWGASC